MESTIPGQPSVPWSAYTGGRFTRTDPTTFTPRPDPRLKALMDEAYQAGEDPDSLREAPQGFWKALKARGMTKDSLQQFLTNNADQLYRAHHGGVGPETPTMATGGRPAEPQPLEGVMGNLGYRSTDVPVITDPAMLLSMGPAGLATKIGGTALGGLRSGLSAGADLFTGLPITSAIGWGARKMLDKRLPGWTRPGGKPTATPGEPGGVAQFLGKILGYKRPAPPPPEPPFNPPTGWTPAPIFKDPEQAIIDYLAKMKAAPRPTATGFGPGTGRPVGPSPYPFFRGPDQGILDHLKSLQPSPPPSRLPSWIPPMTPPKPPMPAPAPTPPPVPPVAPKPDLGFPWGPISSTTPQQGRTLLDIMTSWG